MLLKSFHQARTKRMCEIEGSRKSVFEFIQPPLRKFVVFGEDDQTDQQKQNALQKRKKQPKDAKHNEAPSYDHGKEFFYSWLHGQLEGPDVCQAVAR